jgi:hypothetical protein
MALFEPGFDKGDRSHRDQAPDFFFAGIDELLHCHFREAVETPPPFQYFFENRGVDIVERVYLE